MSTAQDFIRHEQSLAAIQVHRAELEAARHAAADREDWDGYDALEAEIDQTFDESGIHTDAMTKIANVFTADDRAELKALRSK